MSREFRGMQLDEVVHADWLLACELEQVVGHTVVAAFLVHLRHHGEVLDDVRRHARPQKLFAPAGEWHVAIVDCPTQRLGEHARVVFRESSSRASSLLACYALGPPASAAPYSCRREPCTGRSAWLPLGRACLSAWIEHRSGEQRSP